MRDDLCPIALLIGTAVVMRAILAWGPPWLAEPLRLYLSTLGSQP